MTKPHMQRMGSAISLNADKVVEYKKLHADVWPEVLKMIRDCNITNYSIFLREPENLLFSYWEYTGTDFDADMARMAAHEQTRRWWTFTDPCQKPFASCAEGEKWAPMEEVFHAD